MNRTLTLDLLLTELAEARFEFEAEAARDSERKQAWHVFTVLAQEEMLRRQQTLDMHFPMVLNPS
jgi:hypothetical protein